jgi:hypothetical protein
MLPEGVENELVYSDFIQSYESIFIIVNDWEQLGHSDLERSHIDEVQEETSVPNFVTNFERRLDREPYLLPNVRRFLDLTVCHTILTVSVGAYFLRSFICHIS